MRRNFFLRFNKMRVKHSELSTYLESEGLHINLKQASLHGAALVERLPGRPHPLWPCGRCETRGGYFKIVVEECEGDDVEVTIKSWNDPPGSPCVAHEFKPWISDYGFTFARCVKCGVLELFTVKAEK